MKRTNLLMLLAIVVGIVLIFMDFPASSLLLYYFLPAIVIVNGVRMWEMKQLEKKGQK